MQWVTWWPFWSSWHIPNQVDLQMWFPSELETVIGQSGENFTNRNLPYICLFVWMDTSGSLAYIWFWSIVDFKNLQYKNLMQFWNHKLVVLSNKWLVILENIEISHHSTVFTFSVSSEWVFLPLPIRICHISKQQNWHLACRSFDVWTIYESRIRLFA